MATLGQLAQYDAGRTIQFAEAGRKQRTLSELGQLASQGDFRGAQAAAFAGGETEMGLALKQMNDQDKQRLVGQAASWAYQADTPEKWEAGRQQWASEGFDIGPFQSRDALLSQALSVQDRMTQDYRERSLDLQRQKVAQDAAGSGELGLNPVYYYDEQGNIRAGQTSKSGAFSPINIPGGGAVLTPGQRAADAAAGKISGEALANLPKDIAQAEKTIENIDALKVHKGLPSILGPVDQYRPSMLMGAEGRDAKARYDQLQGTAFLQAYQMLKGGGQITEIEGAKAEAAMARMDRAQSVADFQRALDDFRDAVKSGVDKLRAVASRSGPAGAVAPSDGGWQTLSNGVRFREVR